VEESVRAVSFGHSFTAKVRKLGHEVEEGNPQSIVWRVAKGGTEGVLCPACGSPVVPAEEYHGPNV
jgi:hypothetical protein